ncbi:hypothetical protein AURDEDRAFT_178931 [Auricularia subglabra TFB-10046 SS5]|nr:hypothetical protein AURDEDRAFT_178931 [Auricularia subglabra TFB-10046 SS5]
MPPHVDPAQQDGPAATRPRIDLKDPKFCVECEQYMSEPRICKGKVNPDNKDVWYRVCWDNNKKHDPESCSYLAFDFSIAKGKGGYKHNPKCQSPWCRDPYAKGAGNANGQCGFHFCRTCCGLARKAIQAKAPCPYSDHNYESRTSSTKPATFGSYLDPAYEHKLQVLEAERKQREVSNARSKAAAKRDQHEILVHWWTTNDDEPIYVHVPTDGARFHPKDSHTLVEVVGLTPKTVYQVLIGERWIWSSFEAPATDIKSMSVLNFRSSGVTMGANMPCCTTKPSVGSQYVPIDLLDSEDETMDETAQSLDALLLGATGSRSASSGAGWPKDYATMASRMEVMSCETGRSKGAVGKKAVKPTFGQVFPGTRFVPSTYYNYLKYWNGASHVLKDQYSADPPRTMGEKKGEVMESITAAQARDLGPEMCKALIRAWTGKSFIKGGAKQLNTVNSAAEAVFNKCIHVNWKIIESEEEPDVSTLDKNIADVHILLWEHRHGKTVKRSDTKKTKKNKKKAALRTPTPPAPTPPAPTPPQPVSPPPPSPPGENGEALRLVPSHPDGPCAFIVEVEMTLDLSAAAPRNPADEPALPDSPIAHPYHGEGERKNNLLYIGVETFLRSWIPGKDLLFFGEGDSEGAAFCFSLNFEGWSKREVQSLGDFGEDFLVAVVERDDVTQARLRLVRDTLPAVPLSQDMFAALTDHGKQILDTAKYDDNTAFCVVALNVVLVQDRKKVQRMIKKARGRNDMDDEAYISDTGSVRSDLSARSDLLIGSEYGENDDENEQVNIPGMDDDDEEAEEPSIAKPVVDLGPYASILSPERPSKRKKAALQQQKVSKRATKTLSPLEFIHLLWKDNEYIQHFRRLKNKNIKIEVRWLAKIVRATGRLAATDAEFLRRANVRTLKGQVKFIAFKDIAAYLRRRDQWVSDATDAYALQLAYGPGGEHPHPQVVELLTTNTSGQTFGLAKWLATLQRAATTVREVHKLAEDPAGAPRRGRTGPPKKRNNRV